MSASASGLAASTFSRGPACSVRGFQRSSSAAIAARGQRRGAQVACRRLAPSAASSADRVQREGRGELPAVAAARGSRNTPTGRSTRSTGRQLRVGERQPGVARRSASSAGRRRRRRRGARAPSRESCVADRRVEAEPARERAPPVVAARPRRRGRRGRSAAARARARSASSSAPAGVVTRDQSRPASRSASAWPAISARTAVQLEPGRVDAGDAVAAQDRRGVGVGVEPGVGVVGVDGPVVGQAQQRAGAQQGGGRAVRPKQRVELAAGVGARARGRSARAFAGRRARPAGVDACRGRARRPRRVGRRRDRWARAVSKATVPFGSGAARSVRVAG